MTGMGAGLTWGSALIAGHIRRTERWHEKLAFMFPGQGSFEPGMGRGDRRGRARGDGGLRRRQQGVRASTCERLCFSGTAEELTQTEVQQPALVATSLAINAALRARGIEPDYVVGHSVGEFSALGAARLDRASARRSRLVRERGLAMAAAAKERPGSMAAILGLADEVVEALCRKIHERVAGELQLPRPARHLGRDRRRRRVLRRRPQREGARRAIRLQGLGRVPLAARRARRRAAAARRSSKIDFKVPTAQFVSTVTAKLEDVGALPLAARRAAHRAGQVHAGGARADRARRHDLRRGRARQRAQRFTEEDRQLREGDPGQRPGVARRGRAR